MTDLRDALNAHRPGDLSEALDVSRRDWVALHEAIEATRNVYVYHALIKCFKCGEVFRHPFPRTFGENEFSIRCRALCDGVGYGTVTWELGRDVPIIKWGAHTQAADAPEAASPRRFRRDPR